MLVLAIDPGSSKTGVAWIRESHGTVSRAVYTTVCGGPYPRRYTAFRARLAALFREIPEWPAAIVVEEPVLKDRPGEDQRISQIRLEGTYAIVIAEVSRIWRGVQLFPWTPLIWKGVNVDKADIMRRMGEKYRVEFRNDDESDALGMADYAFGLMRKRIAVKALETLQAPPPEEPSPTVVVAAPAEVPGLEM